MNKHGYLKQDMLLVWLSLSLNCPLTGLLTCPLTHPLSCSLTHMGLRHLFNTLHPQGQIWSVMVEIFRYWALHIFLHTYICDTQPCCIKVCQIGWVCYHCLLNILTRLHNNTATTLQQKVSLTKITISVDPQLSYCANQIKQKQEPVKK